MNKLYLMAAGLLTLAACSQESIETPNAEKLNQIGFNVYNTKAGDSRTTPIASNADFNVSGKSFGVYAAYGLKGFMDNVQISYGEDKANTSAVNKGWGYASEADIAYWPTDYTNKHLTFFAYTPYKSGITFDAANETAKFTDYTVSTTNDEQEDLMYARTKATTKGTTVDMQFKHALAQVKFSIRMKQKGMYAIIAKNGIELHNIYNKNTYTFPGESETQGAWASFALNASTTTYTNMSDTTLAVYDASAFKDVKNVVKYKEDNVDKTRTDVLMLLPQQTKALTVNTTSPITNFVTTNEKGAYLSINLKLVKALAGVAPKFVREVTGDNYTYYKGSADAFETIYIPFNAQTWEQGKIYNYQITIDGNNLLDPIKFTVDVTNWADGGTTDLNNSYN